MISLVVWLILVFLSVTEGIERNWLQKLTTLNAPLRITPTQHYYTSYYYLVDELSSSSGYALKNIAHKMKALDSDPYSPDEDEQLPARMPKPDLHSDGRLKDPVKELCGVLSELKSGRADLVYQDFEISGALMRLQLLRNNERNEASQGYLTQVSYLASFPECCPGLPSLILPMRENDVNHLLYLASHSTELSRQDAPVIADRADLQMAKKRIGRILKDIQVKALTPKHRLFDLPLALLKEGQPFQALAIYRSGRLIRLEIPTQSTDLNIHNPVTLWKEKGELFIESTPGSRQKISFRTPLYYPADLFNWMSTGYRAHIPFSTKSKQFCKASLCRERSV